MFRVYLAWMLLRLFVIYTFFLSFVVRNTFMMCGVWFFHISYTWSLLNSLDIWVYGFHQINPVFVKDYFSSFSSLFSPLRISITYILWCLQELSYNILKRCLFLSLSSVSFLDSLFYCFPTLRNFTRMKKIKNSVCAYIFTFARPHAISSFKFNASGKRLS